MSVKIGNIDIGEFPLLLAPMEDVSDPPFRALCKENGADVMYTEFISSEGLIRDAHTHRFRIKGIHSPYSRAPYYASPISIYFVN